MSDLGEGGRRGEAREMRFVSTTVHIFLEILKCNVKQV